MTYLTRTVRTDGSIRDESHHSRYDAMEKALDVVQRSAVAHVEVHDPKGVLILDSGSAANLERRHTAHARQLETIFVDTAKLDRDFSRWALSEGDLAHALSKLRTRITELLDQLQT